MLRLLALAVSLLPLPAFALCSGPSFVDLISDEARVDLRTRTDATLFGEGLYWLATKDGVEVAIMGTMHLPDPRHGDLVERVRPRLGGADVLLVEATKDDQTEMQTYMARNADLMVISDGPTLPDLLPPDIWEDIRAAATERGIPGFMAAKMQPWFLSLSLSLPTCATTAMMNGEQGLDGLLMDVAADLSIPIEPLEPWESMFGLLTSGTFEEQVDALRLGLLPADIQNAMMLSLIDGYFNSQTAFGWHLSRYSVEFLPNLDTALFEQLMAELEQELLINRNRNWIPVIETAAQTHDDIFIAFGAAHLFGEEGVLNLMAQNGWDIAPL